MEIGLPVVYLVASLVIILAGSELFTNGIEWFGHKLDLAEGAVGSVLAAVGTAMPETLVPIMAIVFGKGAASHEIGIGAIIGAPLMLSTLAFFVTGLSVVIFSAKGRRERSMKVSTVVVGRDLRFFFLVYAVAIAAGFMPGRPLRILTAAFLLGAYAHYVNQTFKCAQESAEGCDPNPLHLSRKASAPRLRIVAFQVLLALGLIIGAAHVFVHNLEVVAHATGVAPLILATIITPIATELPEKFNSIIWTRQGKDTLAVGNITGAMVFQSSIPPAIGILFTEWNLRADPHGLAAAVTALAACLFAWFELRVHKRLSPWALIAGVFFYAAFIVYTFVLSPAKG